jgi:hypothetical protein
VNYRGFRHTTGDFGRPFPFLEEQMTSQQLSSAKYIAHFASCLLKSKLAERSNSVRAKLFRVLTDTVAYHGSEIPEVKYLTGLFRETGSFDANEGRFRFAIKTALQLIGRSAALSEISATIARFSQDAHTERVFELCLDALGERDKALAKLDDDKRLAVLIRGVIAENEVNDLLDSLTPKSAEREAAEKMVNKAIDEAVAEFREKFGASASQ